MYSLFDIVNLAITNIAIIKFRNEIASVMDSDTLKFLNDFTEDISNSKLINDLISDDSQPQTLDFFPESSFSWTRRQSESSSRSLTDGFNKYLSQLGSPRHLLESLAVAESNWKAEIAAETEKQSLKIFDSDNLNISSPSEEDQEKALSDLLTKGNTLDVFEKFPELLSSLRNADSRYVGEDAADSLFGRGDLSAEDEDDEEEDDTDYVFKILGAYSPKERQNLIAAAAEELDDGPELGSFPRKSLADKFKQPSPPPPKRLGVSGKVNISAVLDRLLEWRVVVAGDLAVTAAVIISALCSGFVRYYFVRN